MMSGFMNLTLNDFGEMEFEEGSATEIFFNIFGDIKFSDVMGSIMSGRYEVLDRVQRKMRNEI